MTHLTMNPKAIIAKKREGGELSSDDLDFWVEGMTCGSITPAQVGAFSMAVVINGMSAAESAHLTKVKTPPTALYSQTLKSFPRHVY